VVRSRFRSEKGHSQLSYCAAQVREHDPDRYLATLFAPAAAREALFSLYAFDHEVARVPRVVSEPMAGLVRLQWWRDALEGLAAGRPLAHPVVEALHARWARFAPLRSRLETAIDAREQELCAGPPADLAALEDRLASSWSEITLGAMELLGAAEEPGHAAGRHLGVALGLVRLLQTLPVDLRQNRMPLPGAMLARDRVAGESLEGEGTAAALRPAVAELAARAGAHLDAARRHRHAVPQRALAALLPAPLLEGYLRRLARAGFDPFAPVPTAPGAFAPLRLLGRYARGRY
jgi:NADH dehydrogenase [ubiquinone] 1 alpha subcomplex assembly factor 6